MATEQPTQQQEVPTPEGHVKATFHFRTEKVRDEDGKVIGEGKKHPNVDAFLPVPSDEDLINAIGAGGKTAQFLRDLVADAVKNAARSQINEFREENKDSPVTPDVLDMSKLTFEALATMERRDRAVEIPEEVYTSFYEDYKTVHTGLGTVADKIAKHIALFKNKFRVAKYDKPALNMMKDRLNMYAAKTENMEDNADVFQELMGKIEKYLKADEKKLIEAL